MGKSRREILAFAGMMPLLALSQRAFAADTACYDPASLPMAQKSLRRSLTFAEVSANPKQKCGLCAFFTATKGNCGTCQMLSGNPVTALGICSSFAPKA